MDMGGITAVTKADRIEGPASWTIERDVHVLILYEAGGYHWLETWLDGHRTSLGDPLPGEMWLIPAGRVYRGTAQGGAVRYIEVEIPRDLLPGAARARPIAGHDDPALAALVRGLADGKAGAAEDLIARLGEMLAAAVAPPLADATARRIDELMVFIQSQLETPLSVQQMADAAGMSVNSLIANFARAKGRTPAQYMLHQRLRRACWFLANRPLSIAEIAFATGFSSHAHMCAAFRGKLAMSPGEWRRRARLSAVLDGRDPSAQD